MKPVTILVVEDEILVARDLQSRLISMGYAVPSISSSGEDALHKTRLLSPDLALIDIRLKGEMDGVEAAEQMRDSFDIPCVYLTAYTDEDTLRRARITEPYGYIVKPFEERGLQIAIEVALSRHRIEQRLRRKEQWLAALLPCLEDAVILTSAEGAVVLVNPAAARLTGWTQNDAAGSDVKTVFKLGGDEANARAEHPAAILAHGAGALTVEKRLCLRTRDGKELPVHCRAVPIQDEAKRLHGLLLVFRRTRDAALAQAGRAADAPPL
jgi:PAS domain S-box-containing protein